jgi:hypothetical protein
MNLNPGQCYIKSITITDSTGSKVLSKENGFLEYVHSIDIYESIFTPYILADLFLLDGSSLKERFNFSGNEDFTIEFLGYGNDQSLSYSMKLVEVKAQLVSNNLRSKTIAIRLASKELLTNSSQKIAKSYTSSSEEIIQDILSNTLLTGKPLTAETTKSLPVTVIPFMSPFEGIDFIRKRSVSREFLSSAFIFFENKNGYYFTTAESIIKNKNIFNGIVEVPTYFQKEDVSSNIKDSPTAVSDSKSHFLFANYTVNTPVNVNHLLSDGGLNTEISQYDFTTKVYSKRLFRNTPNSKIFTELTDGKNTILTDSISNDYSSGRRKPMLLPFATYRDSENKTNNFLYDSLPERVCFSNLFTQQRTYIDIPGNTKLLAGSIINLEVPRHDSMELPNNRNEIESGYYIVSSIKHSISITEDSKFSSHLELMRHGRGVFEQ